MKWKPIETAPKDGSQVPVGNLDNPNGEWPFMGEWDVHGQKWRIHIDGQIIGPTHWLQLPEMPKTITTKAIKHQRKFR